jgi:hypothetical protein
MRIPGIVFTVLTYAWIVLVAVALLAAVQIRSSGGGADYDTWRLNYDANQELAKAQREEVDTTRAQLEKDRQGLAFVRYCLKLFDAKGVPLTEPDAETARRVKEAIEKRTKLEDLEGNVRCLVQGSDSLKADEDFWTISEKEHSGALDELTKSLAMVAEQRDQLTKGHQDFMAFRKMESVPYQRPFLAIPYDFLVLLLVMTMGGVGGIVRLLRDFGSSVQPNPDPKDYIFIPMIGAVVAIGGYVLAKTGLLLLSSTKGDTSLSPYMVSLVGIVSGLLASEVIETIATSGRKILRREGGGATPSSEA